MIAPLVRDNGKATVIQGNSIGTNAAGALNLGNGSQGIYLAGGAANTLIGGTVAAAANVIAFNNSDGIGLGSSAGAGNAILRNSIYANTSQGIDLGADGVTTNDVGDADTGANNLQNFPVLTSAVSAAGNTTITGTLNSNASTNYRIEFYSSPSADSSGYGEGQVFLGAASVTTNGSGDATINALLTGVTVSAGHFVSATATVDLGGSNYGSTSEFSQVLATSPNTAPTFSTTNGLVTTDVATLDDSGRGIAVQADGKLVVAGYANLAGNYDLLLTRYNVDGSLDTGFGTGDSDGIAGLSTIDLGASERSFAIAVQSDGRILVGGELVPGTPAEAAAELRQIAAGLRSQTQRAELGALLRDAAPSSLNPQQKAEVLALLKPQRKTPT